MASIFQRYRRICGSLGDAVRWACALEVMAPKVGNVHPSASFDDLHVSDFLSAGEILAQCAESNQTVGTIVRSTVSQTQQRLGTNVNLGIALLIAPLLLARRKDVDTSRVLGDLNEQDAVDVFEAILLANPGGLGDSSEMDVRATPPRDLMAAMRYSKERDLIAKQYADNFVDLNQVVIPAIVAGVEQEGDMLLGIRVAQIRILADLGDSLISRKCGSDASAEVRRRAENIASIKYQQLAWQSQLDLDGWMRASGNRRNPGATADLIAAGLFVLLSDGLLSDGLLSDGLYGGSSSGADLDGF